MIWRQAIATGLAMLAAGCAQVGYYAQAVQGELSLLSDARPIDDWLADPGTNAVLKNRLEQVKRIRQFAARELGLPDNGTFKTYTDIKRPYVLWNVVATPELSLQAIQWCFPIAGCVNYRGYYSQEAAQSFATGLRQEGFDVQVAGVLAYSTLGWFNDPVLSTFLTHPDAQLARLIFHELAHQVAYAPGDSQFNESFATTVEEVGIERWLATYGDEDMRNAHRQYEARKQDFLTLLQKHRNALAENYASAASPADKKKQKQAIFQALKEDYQALKATWGGYRGYDRWFAEPLSNAHLASVATYHDFVPAFRALLAQEKSLPQFYAAIQGLAALDKATRQRRLGQFIALSSPVAMQRQVR